MTLTRGTLPTSNRGACTQADAKTLNTTVTSYPSFSLPQKPGYKAKSLNHDDSSLHHSLPSHGFSTFHGFSHKNNVGVLPAPGQSSLKPRLAPQQALHDT